MKFLDSSREIIVPDLFMVWATMRHPNDEQKRSEFVTVSHADSLDRAGPHAAGLRAIMPATHENLVKLARLPSYDEINERAYAAKYPGFVAGWILGYILTAKDERPLDATVRKARFIFAERLVSKLNSRGKKIQTSQAFLKVAWRDFKPVAHLLAAHEFFHLHAQISGGDNFDPANIKTLPNFLAFSEQLRVAGESFVPHGSTSPLLDRSETWRVPPNLKLPLLDIPKQRLNDWVEGVLHGYMNE